MINTKNILTVDDATTISDNDTLFVGQNSQLKQIDYDLLADAILNKISSKSYSELDTTAKTLIGAIDELNSKSIGESGTWTPELTAGVTITQGGGYYYKLGKLVYCNVVIWVDTSQATDEELTISLPFISDHVRSYGTVGYINPLYNLPNLCVGIINKNNSVCLIYGNSNGTTSRIKGNQINTAIQFTLTYVTT